MNNRIAIAFIAIAFILGLQYVIDMHAKTEYCSAVYGSNKLSVKKCDSYRVNEILDKLAIEAIQARNINALEMIGD